MNQQAEQFLIRAKTALYMEEALGADAIFPGSRSRQYTEGGFRFVDTCLGTEQFAGQEVLWAGDTPFWTMNYLGRILGPDFPQKFFREALSAGCCSFPYRGAEHYQSGDWVYKRFVRGEQDWFYGYEEILCREVRVYECAFHGGKLQ